MDLITFFLASKAFRGSNLFSDASTKEQERALSHIAYIERETGIALSPAYKDFFRKYYPFKFRFDLDSIPDEFEFGVYSDSNHCFAHHRFVGFLTEKKIVANWVGTGFDLREEYDSWQMIKWGVFENPNGGLYLGYGDLNHGKLFWVSHEYLNSEIDFLCPQPEDSHAIRLIGNNITEFVETLRITLS